MTQVRPATTTISRNRIVYAEGRLSRRRRFAGTASMAGAAAVMVGPPSLQPRRLARRARRDAGRLDPRPLLAGDDAAELAEGADRGRPTGVVHERDRGLDLRAHRTRREPHLLQLVRRGPADRGLLRSAVVAIDGVHIGRHHEQVGFELLSEQRACAVLVDHALDADEPARSRLVHRRDATAAGADDDAAALEEPADRPDLEDPDRLR